MFHVFEFFSTKSDSTRMEQNYILLFRLSSISYFIPLLVHIFFSTRYREFYGEFCTNSCWKLCHCFIIDISATLNKSRSNWKYSIRAPCFYIFASSMVGFFRSWLSNPPFERCVWNSSRVCVHPPRRFAETLPPMFIFPPPPRIVSKLLDRRIRTFILPLSGIRATPSPLCTWHGCSNCPSICNVLERRRFHRYFPVTISRSSLPPPPSL